MITNLYIKNFKSLKEVNLELRPLNLLTGLNGSGKSSLIQALLLTRQNRLELFESMYFRLYGDLFTAGRFDDIYYRYSKTNDLILQYKFDDNSDFGLYYQKRGSNLDNLPIDRISRKLPNGNNLEIASNSFSHHDQNSVDYLKRIGATLLEYALFSDNFQYLFAERRYLDSRTQYVSVEDVVNRNTLGIKGEHTAFYIKTYGLKQKVEHAFLKHEKAKSDYLLHQVDAWLSEVSPNVNLVTQLESDSRDVSVFFQYGDEKYQPKNVGFGLSYVLPVVTALLTAEAGKLIIIENPESHIHPRGQAELGRLIAAAAQTGAQLIIETHSDHILNGIRVAVKENPTIKDLVNIFFHDRVEKEGEQYTEITPIQIDRNGELNNYPENFLDEWSNQLFKLV